MARANWIQGWKMYGDGLFDAVGMVRVIGGTFASPALTFNSGATGWAETNNAEYAFASFDPTLQLNFTTDVLSAPSQFAFYGWRGNTLVESDLIDSQLTVTKLSADGAPTRNELFALSGGTTVPEPGTLFLLGLGLIGLAFVANRTHRTPAGTATA
ncbi:MAG: PEP-CTERM sorting domain-containing protein [Minisyncoccota bacterium]